MEIERISSVNISEYESIFKTFMKDRYEKKGISDLEAFSMVDDDEIYGIIAVDTTELTPAIEFIYMQPELRFMGMGTKLLHAAELAMVSNGAQDMVALYYKDKNTGLNQYDIDVRYVNDFFEKNGYLLTKLGDIDGSSKGSLEIMYAAKVL